MKESMTHRIHLYAVLSLLIIGSVCLMGCNDTQSETNNQDPDDTSTTSNYISALNAFTKMKSEIQQWDENFRIARIHHFGTSEYRTDAKEESWEFYVESADGTKSTDFTYTVSSGTTKAIDTSYGTGRHTCSYEELKIDSTEATTIALNNIRSEIFPNFDGGCKTELLVNENNTPYWKINANHQRKNGHIDLDKPNKYAYAEINAKTGDIIQIKGDNS